MVALHQFNINPRSNAMKKSSIPILMLFLITLGLAGCGGEEAVKPAAKQEPSTPAQPSAAEQRPMAVETKLPAERRVHFVFDSSSIDAENRTIIEANATYLSGNPQAKVSLEG